MRKTNKLPTHIKCSICKKTCRLSEVMTLENLNFRNSVCKKCFIDNQVVMGVELPKKEKRQPVTVELDPDLLVQVKEKVKEHGITIRQVVEFGFKYFLEQAKEKPIDDRTKPRPRKIKSLPLHKASKRVRT